MGLVIVAGIFEQVWVAQVEGLKDDHVKSEVMVKYLTRLVEDIMGLSTFHGHLWLSKLGGVHYTLLRDIKIELFNPSRHHKDVLRLENFFIIGHE